MEPCLGYRSLGLKAFFFFFYEGSDNCGSFLTSHLSKLPWVRNQGLNHTHCDSASRAGCKNIMTSPVWLQDRLCLSSLPTQRLLGAAAGHEAQEECPTEACGNPSATELRRVCCQAPVELSGRIGWIPTTKRAEGHFCSKQRKTTSLWSPESPSKNSSWKADHSTLGFPPHNVPSLNEAGRDLEVIHANKLRMQMILLGGLRPSLGQTKAPPITLGKVSDKSWVLESH